MDKKKLLVPLVTPFKDDETVNYEALAKLVRKVLDEGADGIYAVGSSAEAVLLTDEERKKCLETIIKAADGAYVVAHVGNIGTKKTIELAKHAEKVGADAVASVPPFYFGYGFEGVKSYYRDLAASVKIPTMVYNLPSSTGTVFTPAQLTEIMMLPGVDLLKFTDCDYYTMQQVKAASGKFVYSGMDQCFLSAIAAGADGGIGTTYNYMLGKYQKVAKFFCEGKLEEALAVQSSANNITRVTIENGLLNSTKYILKLQGIDCGGARRPFTPMTDEQRAKVKKVYEENM